MTVPVLGETYFAHVDANNVVDQVIVSDQEHINQTYLTKRSEWVQTYLTPEQGKPKNYAGIGYTWNSSLNCFVAPKPAVTGAAFDGKTCLWTVPPVELRPVK